MYVLLAVMIVGTKSYTNALPETALSDMVQLSFGKAGGVGISIIALFISIASSNAYVSAGSRIAYTLSNDHVAPKWFGVTSATYHSPIGGLIFIGIIFGMIMIGAYYQVLTLETLLPFPSATYFATYIGGAAAGIRLLKNHRIGRLDSMTSLVVTLAFFPFLGWVSLYPVAVVIVVMLWSTFTKRNDQIINSCIG